MQIILTGGAGFIGSCLLNALNRAGYSDITIVDNLSSSPKWQNLVNKEFSDYIPKDAFLDAVEHDKITPPDLLLHLGACTSTTETDADYMLRNNYAYSKKLAGWALQKDIRFIYASSAAVYGGGESGFSDSEDIALMKQFVPLNIYGFSKLLFDLWVVKNSLSARLTGLRFFNVYGPNEEHKGEMRSVVSKAWRQISDTGKLRLFKSYRDGYSDGEQKRDFIYVRDVADIIMFFVGNPVCRGIFNVGTGQARSFNELAGSVFRALGRPANMEYIPMPDSIRGQYQYFTRADMSRLMAAGYKKSFTSLEDGVGAYVQYLANHRRI